MAQRYFDPALASEVATILIPLRWHTDTHFYCGASKHGFQPATSGTIPKYWTMHLRIENGSPLLLRFGIYSYLDSKTSSGKQEYEYDEAQARCTNKILSRWLGAAYSTVSCRRLRFIVDVLQLWNTSTTLKMSNGAYSVRNECGWWSGTSVRFLHVSPRKMIPRNASIPNPSRNVTNNRTDGVILIEHTYNTMNFKEVKNWSRYRDSRPLAPFSSTFSIPSKDHLKLQIRNSWHTTLSHESW